MRRALTTGLALYLGLGGVLSTPVQVQAPFELNKENIPEVEDIPTSASVFQFFCFFLVIFHRDGLDDERAAKIERTSANLVCSNPGPPRQLQGRFLHITDLHPDPLYQPGGAVSTACHRREPEKEKHRAGYLGTPYGFVIFSCSSRSLLFPEALAGNCWICNGMTVTESLILFFFLGIGRSATRLCH